MGFEPIPWFSQNQMLTATTITPYKTKNPNLLDSGFRISLSKII